MIGIDTQAMRTLLTRRRLPAATELVLQDAIAAAFTAEGVAFERELVLSPKDRIDFLCAEGVGVEVKIGGSLSDVTRQLHRYAQSDRIASLVLVSNRMRLLTIPRVLNGKRIDFIHLEGAAF